MSNARNSAWSIYSPFFLLDPDNFKVINYSLGHRIGDELLTGVTERRNSCLRIFDFAVWSTEDTTARFGGDEFLILLDGIKELSDGAVAATRVCDTLSKPFHIDGHEVVVSVSMGIATNQKTYETPDDMMRDADMALYQAKALGKWRFEVFNQAMRAANVCYSDRPTIPPYPMTIFART